MIWSHGCHFLTYYSLQKRISLTIPVKWFIQIQISINKPVFECLSVSEDNFSLFEFSKINEYCQLTFWLCFIPPRIQFAILAARLVLNLLSSSTPRFLSAKLLSSLSSPHSCLCPELLCLRCRIWCSFLLKFMPLLIVQCSSLSRNLFKASQSSRVLTQRDHLIVKKITSIPPLDPIFKINNKNEMPLSSNLLNFLLCIIYWTNHKDLLDLFFIFIPALDPDIQCVAQAQEETWKAKVL